MPNINTNSNTPPLGTSALKKTISPPPTTTPLSSTGATPRLSLKDEVAQSNADKGQATTVSFVDGSAKAKHIRGLLKLNKAEEIEALVSKMPLSELKSLNLNSAEIRKISTGLKESGFAGVGSYTDAEQNVVERLIKYNTHLSSNQKIMLLEQLGSDETLIQFAFSEQNTNLSTLSTTNKSRILKTLQSDNSILGTIQGAATELYNRRYQGENAQDLLASKVLLSAKNETELKSMIQTLNQFSKDDVVYHYILNLPAQKLKGLSDDTKKVLLKQLVDSSINLPFFDIDLNAIGNLDESVNMTFKGHAEAAKRVYHYMSLETRQSKEVQTTISKSDTLLKEISDLERDLSNELKSSNLSTDRIASYKQKIQGLIKSADHPPEVQARLDKLSQLIQKAEDQLKQTDQSKFQLDKTLASTQAEVQKIESQLKPLQSQVQGLNQKLRQTKKGLETSQTHLLKQYDDMLTLRQNLKGVTGEYQNILAEMNGILTSKQNPNQKLAQLEGMNIKLHALDASANNLEGENTATLEKLQTLKSDFNASKDSHNELALKHNGNISKLDAAQNKLKSSMAKYQTNITTLAGLVQSAKKGIQELQSSSQPIEPQLLTNIQESIKELDTQLAGHKKSLQSAKGVASKHFEKASTLSGSLLKITAQVKAQGTLIAQSEAVVNETSTLTKIMEEPFQTVKAAISSLLSEAQTAIQKWKKQLPNLNPNDIQALQTEMNNLKVKLSEDKSLTADQLQDQLAKISEIENMVKTFSDNIESTQTQQSNLEKNIAELNSLKGNISSELNETKNAIKEVEDILEDTSLLVKNTQAELESLNKDLSGYQESTSILEANLKEIQSQRDSGKQDYASGKLSEQAFLKHLTKIEGQEKKLSQALNHLQAKTSKVTGMISTTKTQLTSYKTTLLAQQSDLTHLQNKASKNIKKLIETNDLSKKNKHLAQNLITKMEGTIKNEALNERFNQLKLSVGKMSEKINDTDLAINKAQNELANSMKFGKEINAKTKIIDSTVHGLTQFENKQLKSLENAIGKSLNEFSQINQKKEKTKQAFNRFINDIKTGKSQHTIEQTIEILNGFKGMDISSEVMRDLQAILKELPAIRSAIDDDRAALLNHQNIRQAGDNLVHFLSKNLNGIKNDIKDIQGQITNTQLELNNTQQYMKETQLQLLEQRKNLGIEASEYQGSLKEYESLLKADRPLNIQEGQKLKDLETRLGNMESQLLNSRGDLKDRILDLNQAKETVNQALDKVSGHVITLNSLESQATQKQTELAQSLTQLQGRTAPIQKRKHQIQTNISALENLIEQYPAFRTELQPRLDELKQDLKETEELLANIATEEASTNQTLENLALKITDLKNTLLDVKNIQSKLLSLSFNIDQTRTALNDMLGEVNQQLEGLEALKSDVQKSIQQIEQISDLGLAPSLPEQPTQIAGQNLGQKTLLGFKKLLGQQTPPPSSKSHGDQALDKAHQAKRKATLKEMQAHIRQAHTEAARVRDNMMQEQLLEAHIDQLIQNAHMGQENTSAMNIVGINA